MRAVVALFAAALLAGCAPLQVPPAPSTAAAPADPQRLDSRTLALNFIAVVEQVEPVAERECRARTRGVNCDFLIVVDDRPSLPPNAFQTRDASGRPIVGFTVGLIADARNRDELAFVLGHEAAHHIAGHLDRQRETATLGAVILGQIATAGGGGEAAVRTAQEIGASVGARTFSKEFELEADALGAVIAARAGFDPLRGAEFFNRVPDPGDRFLGTHPPNSERLRVVRQTVAQFGL